MYRSRRAFHPGRLHAFMAAHFQLQQQDWTQALADAAAEAGRHHHHHHHADGPDGCTGHAHVPAAAPASSQAGQGQEQLGGHVSQGSPGDFMKTLVDATAAAAQAAAAAAQALAEKAAAAGH